MKKITSILMALVLSLTLLPSAALATDAEETSTSIATLTADSTTNTITLQVGKYLLPSSSKDSGDHKTVETGATLTISGAGASETTVYVGGITAGESSATYYFDGAGAVTFKNLTIDFGAPTNYDGFVRAGDMTFENVTIKGMGSHWGSGNVKFTNCTFVYPDENYNEWTYNLWTYSGSAFTFDGCTFIAKLGGGNAENPGKSKFINVYKDGNSTDTVEVTLNNCVFKTEEAEGTTTEPNKPIIKIGNGATWKITVTNADTTNARSKTYEATGSSLYGSDANEGILANANSTVTIDSTVVWKDSKVAPMTVTFNANNGTAATKQTVNYGGTVTLPSDLTKTGYTFGGWYTDGGKKWEDNTPITGDITLFADWTKDGETSGTGDKTTYKVDETTGAVTKTVTNETTDGTTATTTKVESKTTTATNGTTTETETKTVTTEATTTKVETTTTGTAAATEAKVAVEKAEKAKVENAAVTLDATVANEETAEALTKVEVSVLQAAAANLATAKSVEVVTDVGTLTIDSTALKTITEKVANETDKLTLVVEKTSEGTTSTQTTTTTTATYELTAMVGNTKVFQEANKDSNGTITVTVPWTSAPGFRQQIVCYYVDGNNRTRMGGAGYKDGSFSWNTNHFSKFEVVTETVSTNRAYINLNGGSSATTTTTTTTTTTGKANSATTFDAGVGIYAATTILSVTGMAWVGKKKH